MQMARKPDPNFPLIVGHRFSKVRAGRGGPILHPSGSPDWLLRTYGVIAQLGERLNGIQEVGGSIPPGSTSSRASQYDMVEESTLL